jgi:uncharacterized membrane protein YoaK (UPF0700 family)
MPTNWSLAYVESRRARPLLWLLLDLTAGAAMTALLLVVTNRTSAIVFACLWIALIVVSLFSRSRWKHHDHPLARRRVTFPHTGPGDHLCSTR